jgi:hypothetical protein
MRSLKYISPLGNSFTFGVGSFASINSITGVDVPTNTIQEQKAPFQDGSTYIDNLFNPREIVLDGVLNAPQNLLLTAQYRRIIESTLNPKNGPGTIIYTNDFGSWQCTGFPEGPGFGNKDYMVPHQPYEFTFYCNDPFWYDIFDTVVTMNTIVANFYFPSTKRGFPLTGTAFSYYIGGGITVNNGGDMPVYPTITLYGPATNPLVTNTTTGKYIHIIKIMAAGDKIIITGSFGNKAITYIPSGGSAVSIMNLLDTTSFFWPLQLGPNTLSIADDTSSQYFYGILNYRNRYIGV